MPTDNNVLLQEINPDSEEDFIVSPNSSSVQAGWDITWQPSGTDVTITFPVQSPFPVNELFVANGEQGTLHVASKPTLGPLVYVILCHTNQSEAKGDDGDDPTIIFSGE